MTYAGLALSSIDFDPTWNARQSSSKADVRALAESIRLLGLISPVLVCRTAPASRPVLPPGRWWLVDGYQRHAAVRLLHAETSDERWSHIAAREVDSPDQAVGRRDDLTELQHVAANTVRTALHWTDLAARVTELADAGHKQAALGLAFAISPGHVSNLIAARRGLTPDLWAAAQRGALPAARALLVCRLSADAQKEEAESILSPEKRREARAEAAKARRAAKDDAAPKGARAPSTREVKERLELMTTEEERPGTYAEGALAALRWVLGQGGQP